MCSPNFCKNEFAEVSLREVILFSAWVRSSVLAATTQRFRFFGWLPASSVCLDAHLLPSLHFLLDKDPFYEAKQVGWFSLPEGFFLSVSLFAEQSGRGERDGREPCLFLWIHASSLDRLSFRNDLLERV